MIKTLFPPHIKIKNPLYHLRGFANWFGEILRSRSHYVARLEAFRAFEQIELDSLAFIQRAVAVLLDGREMHEDILAGGALDESVALRPVEPLHSTLLSHKESPFASSLRIILSSLVCLPWPMCCNAATCDRTPPQREERIFLLASPRGMRHRTNRNGSPEFRRTVARDEILWSRENEGAISHC